MLRSICGWAAFTCLLANNVSAQDKLDIKFGQIAAEDFSPLKYNLADTSAGALIIADIGSTSFVGNRKGWFSHVFKKFTRVKVLNQNGFDVATIKIQLYTDDGGTEKLTDLVGAVYNMENGSVVQTPLGKTDIFETRLSKNTIEKRITLPGIKAGSIIEYSYTVTSDFYFHIHQWQFQDVQYPCLWSEYTVSIPNLLVYMFIHQGSDSFFVNKSWETRDQFLVSQPTDNSAYAGSAQELNVGAVTNHHRWVIKNTEPLKNESYVSTPYNYVDKIDFQLYQTSDGEVTKDVLNNWKTMSAELLADKNFGGTMEANPLWLKDKLDELTKTDTTLLQSARNIYYFIKNSFTCVYDNSFYVKKSLKDVFLSHQGNTSEINLLLIMMMRQKGITAEPVLLSTKENGFNYTRYPVVDKFNYVVCRASLDDAPYYLDATHAQLPFGSLPNNCYNGLARVVNTQAPDSVYLSSDSLQETKTTLVVITNGDGGKVSGSFTTNPGAFESYDIRQSVAQLGTDGYLKKLKTGLPDNIYVSNFSIDSLREIELPISIKYDFTVGSTAEDAIYFDPFITDIDRKNPFTATERTCPVEMPYRFNRVYILNMEIPTGYRVDEIPKSVRMKLNDNDGLFEYIIGASASRLQLRCRTVLNKAIFAPADYQSLRDFFTFVIKTESQQIVLKKI